MVVKALVSDKNIFLKNGVFKIVNEIINVSIHA